MKKIGVFTSGGDSPGMNACIRAVVRTANYHKMEVIGIRRGYEGLVNKDFIELKAKDVANIIQRGGTILKTSRSTEFLKPEGRKRAFDHLKNEHIEGLIAIGGDGTFKGALQFFNEFAFPILGIAGTIDNDLYGTDFTLGYDTAINTVVDAVDKIRDTAESHDRLFFVEVMGRDAGLIALRSGIGVGAEAILIPETTTDLNDLIVKLSGDHRQKNSKIIMVAEGDDAGSAFEIAAKVKAALPYYDTKVTILGHLQRGGSPSCMDRVLASRLGFSAVEALLKGEKNKMVGLLNNQICYTPLQDAVKHIEEINPDLLRMMEILSL